MEKDEDSPDYFVIQGFWDSANVYQALVHGPIIAKSSTLGVRAIVFWVLVHGPICSRSWCTARYAVGLSACATVCSSSWCMGQCVVSGAASACVFQVVVHGPVCSKSWCAATVF